MESHTYLDASGDTCEYYYVSQVHDRGYKEVAACLSCVDQRVKWLLTPVGMGKDDIENEIITYLG